MDFVELFVVIEVVLASALVILLAMYLDYRIKSKRLALIDKGVWKTDFDQKRPTKTSLAGVILIIIGILVLVGTFWPVDVWTRIGMSVGIALLAIGSVFVAKRQLNSPATAPSPNQK